MIWEKIQEKINHHGKRAGDIVKHAGSIAARVTGEKVPEPILNPLR